MPKLSQSILMAVVAAAVLACACSKWGMHSKAAVERAVQDHLKQNPHLKSDSFETKVESVDFKGDTADAVVRFQSRQSADLFVDVRYGLRLEGGRWQVFSSVPMSGQGGDSHRGPQDQGGAPAGTEPAAPALKPAH